MRKYTAHLLENLPADWLDLTTHRLDIYNEKLAKFQFLEQLEVLYKNKNADTAALSVLPTAFDYIRLGHPLSCVLEWVIGKLHDLPAENIISFSSGAAPVLAILRKNLLQNKKTKIFYTGELPAYFDEKILRSIYDYKFELQQIKSAEEVSDFDGSTVFISPADTIKANELNEKTDFYVNLYPNLGSIIVINGKKNTDYISEIQHVRRRETIAMTPADCLTALRAYAEDTLVTKQKDSIDADQKTVAETLAHITGTDTEALLGSSGLSVQYAVMMGLVHDARETHPGKAIKIIVPPNCYGGTNDQARRVAACLDDVEIVDLPVDGDNDMVQSVKRVLDKLSKEDAVPYIIAEIPTNPRVEVPNLEALKNALGAERKTTTGATAVDPVFILDQTFCPNIKFLAEGGVFSEVRTISYASGSKFPSGGKCTAGYCVGNKNAEKLIEKVALHLRLCDNEATDLQVNILAEQLPSMLQRIQAAYENTREFVDFIKETLPAAKINFVSEELATQGFTPSVFSLDLPTKGENDLEREMYKRELNHKLITMMITEIPEESKYCVSYGQLKGCYWTIPATSTQGTTKESDKDYIARVALSGKMDLEKHKAVFAEFAEGVIEDL